jgi:spore coat polysaccharide biosynthesis protein SpsF (cytidylyltransferase family)
MEIKTILVTQARFGSTRLPGKVLKEVDGKTLLQIHLERLKKCKNITEIVVATTDQEKDLVIFEKVNEWGFNATRGSELDVLDRFYQAVKNEKADWIVRVTSDCPLIDPVLVDEVISFVQDNNTDYGSNVIIEHFPDGQDIEVFKFSALKKAWENSKLLSEREHVTPYIINNSNGKGRNLFTAINYTCTADFSKIRMTVDETEDFELIKILIEKLGVEKSWSDYTNYIIDNSLDKINNNIIRNEGLLKSLKKD